MPEGKNNCSCCDVAMRKGDEAGRSDEYDQRTPGAGFLTKGGVFSSRFYSESGATMTILKSAYSRDVKDKREFRSTSEFHLFTKGCA